MHRVLKQGGKFIIFSHGSPDSGRLDYIRRALLGVPSTDMAAAGGSSSASVGSRSAVGAGSQKSSGTVWGNIEYKSIAKPAVRGVHEDTEAARSHFMYICTKAGGGEGSSIGAE